MLQELLQMLELGMSREEARRKGIARPQIGDNDIRGTAQSRRSSGEDCDLQRIGIKRFSPDPKQRIRPQIGW